MKYPVDSQNQFVVDLLTTLRKERFSPIGWWHFIWRAWEMSCNTANAHPTLKRSWARTTLFIGTLAVAILFAQPFFEGPFITPRFLPGFLLCVAWQQSGLFWPLCLNPPVNTGEPLPPVGLAQTCTSL